MESVKKYPLLPVHIVEDHHDALYHLLRAVGSKHLPFLNNFLLHFDSHPDLLIPPELKASEVFDVPVLLQKLSIENWILPSAFAGQISSIVWVKPPWSNQIEDGQYTFKIGRHKETEQIRVSCPVMYYVGEMLYCPEQELTDTKEITLHVLTLGWELKSDIKENLSKLIEKHGGHYILDIDLDFFSTMNPFIEMHKTVNMYSRLRKIYSFDFFNPEEKEVILAQNKRIKQIVSLKSVFTELQKLKDPEKIKHNAPDLCKSIESDRESLTSLIQDLASEYRCDVDWELVHDAGCTCDDEKHELPHHLSSDEEIEVLMGCTRELLSALPPPTIVTLARSSLDDYCPPDKVDMVQELVCKFLRRTFDIECKSHYLDTDP